VRPGAAVRCPAPTPYAPGGEAQGRAAALDGSTRSTCGVPGLHFHDLRHTGNTLAAGMGISRKYPMARMGHDSERAALLYQHRSNNADRKIADGLNALLEADGSATAGSLVPWPSCTLMARRPNMTEAQVGERVPGLGLGGGASDGNRTRATSLGNLIRAHSDH
jgi:hypothetical protein